MNANLKFHEKGRCGLRRVFHSLAHKVMAWQSDEELRSTIDGSSKQSSCFRLGAEVMFVSAQWTEAASLPASEGCILSHHEESSA